MSGEGDSASELRREADCDEHARAIAAAAGIIGQHLAIEVWKRRAPSVRRTAKDINLSKRQDACMARKPGGDDCP